MTTTLLGVDDSKTMRRVLEITFAGEDFRTVLAENADDAMSKLHAERPSVVLVDAALDGTNGYELCQRVKAAAPGVGVILLSSKQQPYDKSRGGQVGADDFIDKPFDTQQLLDKVVAVVRRAASSGAHPAVTAPAPMSPAAAPATPGASPGRVRTQTLAYGTHMTPSGGFGTAPVAPLVPPPVTPAAVPAAPPIAAAAPQPVPAPQPVARPAAPAYTPPPPVRPASAPAPFGASVAAAETANGGDLSHKLAGLGLTPEQVAGVLALSREVVERVVWEVVPTLAETLIQEEIRRLTSD